ncbi:hypothetical protein LCGC14_1396450 [marine sediment metagenome]|uniref:Uncharacterized protein n=1 Tax=marine sediment metagenome TaxID=412755 RepID=A0A0F9JYI4_9ZZZZ
MAESPGDIGRGWTVMRSDNCSIKREIVNPLAKCCNNPVDNLQFCDLNGEEVEESKDLGCEQCNPSDDAEEEFEVDYGLPQIGGTPMGWKCPECKRVNAPYVSQCPCTPPQPFTPWPPVNPNPWIPTTPYIPSPPYEYPWNPDIRPRWTNDILPIVIWGPII